MCWCTPEMRTPFCGKPGCAPPLGVADASTIPQPAYTPSPGPRSSARRQFDHACYWFECEGASKQTVAYMLDAIKYLLDATGQ